MPTISAFLSQASKALLNFDKALEAVSIEVFTVQALRLRTNQWRVHEATYLQHTKSDLQSQGFHNGQATILT